ncbi:MAG: hypothetical protein Kow0070_31420 [Anaerolineales bacterium]
MCVGKGVGRGEDVTIAIGKAVGVERVAVAVKAGAGAGVLLPLQAASSMAGNKTIQRFIRSSISIKINGI